MSKLLQIIIGFCLVIITLSLAYYFVIYLPNLGLQQEITKKESDCRDRAERKVMSMENTELEGAAFYEEACWAKYTQAFGSTNSNIYFMYTIEDIDNGTERDMVSSKCRAESEASICDAMQYDYDLRDSTIFN